MTARQIITTPTENDMNDTKYYGNDTDTFVVNGAGTIYLVASEDWIDYPEIVDALPADVVELSQAACLDLDIAGTETTAQQIAQRFDDDGQR